MHRENGKEGKGMGGQEMREGVGVRGKRGKEGLDGGEKILHKTWSYPKRGGGAGKKYFKGGEGGGELAKEGTNKFQAVGL